MVIKRQINIGEDLFFLLGILTTIQILTIGGITGFSSVLILTVVIALVLNSKRLKSDTYFWASVVVSSITIFLSLCNGSLTNGFRKAAIIGGITHLLLLAMYLIMNTKVNYAAKLLQGFDLSCKITLVWCCLQLIVYYLLHEDLNAVVFDQLLRISGARGDYANGVLIPSGFYYHRAILIPTFIYMLFSASSPYWMGLILVVGCLTRSTALIMGLMLGLAFKVCSLCLNPLPKTIKSKKMILILPGVAIAIIGIIAVSPKIAELVGYIVTRVTDATSNKADNSSVVHFLYYKNLFQVLQKMDFRHLLFGTGFGTSGIHYTWFNGQYADLSFWVVESDYVNILLGQGIIGFVLWGYVLVRMILLSIQWKYWENIAFILIVAFVGVMYNIQFTWFLLIEFAMLILTKNKLRIFNTGQDGGKIQI